MLIKKILSTIMILMLSGIVQAGLLSNDRTPKEAVIMVEQAPIRDTIFDGRIIHVVTKGQKIIVTQLTGDGRGMWYFTKIETGNRTINGLIDKRFINLTTKKTPAEQTR